MGMTVYAYTASPRPTPESRKDHGYHVPGTGDPEGILPSSWSSGTDKESLHKFLSQDLDHIVVCTPLTPETTHLLGAEEFSVLSSHSSNNGRKPFVTNISRGKVIQTDALVAALNSGELSGAALDVIDPEPLPDGSPIWSTPNLQISPHISGLNNRYYERALDILQVNIDRLLSGEELMNRYHRHRGY